MLRYAQARLVGSDTRALQRHFISKQEKISKPNEYNSSEMKEVFIPPLADHRPVASEVQRHNIRVRNRNTESVIIAQGTSLIHIHSHTDKHIQQLECVRNKTHRVVLLE